MKIPRILLLASAVGTGSIVSVAAQQPAAPSPETLAVAKELVALMTGDMVNDMARKTSAQSWPSIEQGLRRQYPQIDAATIADLRAEFEKVMLNSVTEGMNDAPIVYARYLTVQEMRDIQVFYRTPTGAKMLKLTPQIMGEVMANLAPRMQGNMQRINVAFTDILKKHGLPAQ
jgi:uncharacterized protein